MSPDFRVVGEGTFFGRVFESGVRQDSEGREGTDGRGFRVSPSSSTEFRYFTRKPPSGPSHVGP